MTRNAASVLQERAIISDASQKHSPSPSLALKHSFCTVCAAQGDLHFTRSA